jgi:hypothetical protein
MPPRIPTIEVPGDGPRDARLRKIVAQTGMRSVNALLGQVADILSRVPPRHFYRILGAVEAEIERLKQEGKL